LKVELNPPLEIVCDLAEPHLITVSELNVQKAHVVIANCQQHEGKINIGQNYLSKQVRASLR